MNDFPLTVSKYVQDIWRVEILNLCPILFLNKGAHRHGNIDLYIMGIYNSKKTKMWFQTKNDTIFPKKSFLRKKLCVSQKQKPIKNPQNESFDEKNTGFITKYRTKKKLYTQMLKKFSYEKIWKKNQWTP